jgi:hypothetical protein
MVTIIEIYSVKPHPRPLPQVLQHLAVLLVEHLGFGRMVVSEIEAPNTFAVLV